MSNVFVRNLTLPAIIVPAGTAVLGTDMPKLMVQDLLVSKVSRFVHNHFNCLFTNRLMSHKGSSYQRLSVTPDVVPR